MFAHAVEMSERIYPREQIPLHCGGRVHYAWDLQIQWTPVTADISAPKVISVSFTGWVSTEIYLPLTSCLFLGYLVPTIVIPVLPVRLQPEGLLWDCKTLCYL